MSKPTAAFNASDLATVVPGLIVVGSTPYRYPNRNVTTQPIANSDKSVTSSAFYKDKKINVQVEIGQNTREQLDDAIDIMNFYLQGKEKALVLSVGTAGQRQWTATLSNVSYSNVKGGHAEIDLEFEVADPIGRDVNSTQLFSTNLTGSNSNTPFVISGNIAPWQLPVITITISALTGGTTKNVVIGNAATGQQATITRTWIAGDVLVIDSSLKKITVNGIEVSFSGAIPEWAPGSGSMDYSDTLTTRTRSMVGIVFKRYV